MFTLKIKRRRLF